MWADPQNTVCHECTGLIPDVDYHKFNQICDWGNCDIHGVCNVVLKTTYTVTNDSNMTLY